MTWVVLASGPSLTTDDVEYVRILKEINKIKGVIAISDVGLLMAPWADALVSHDSAWWITKKGSIDFKGRKFSARAYRKTEGFDPKKYGWKDGINSGLMGMLVAKHIFKAKTLVLLGFDMHRKNGQHFFGNHTEVFNKKELKNTDEEGFKKHLKQFEKFSGCEVYNCTPGSALETFPKRALRDIL